MSRLKRIVADSAVPINEDSVEQNDQEELELEGDLNVEGAKVAIEAINNSVNEIVESYKVLFNQLNSLYEEYSPLYNEMKKIVRFPTEKNAKDVLDMQKDLEFLSGHYEDTKYLAQIIDVFKK